MCWDLLPSFFTKIDDLYDKDKFQYVDFMAEGDYPALYKNITDNLDALLRTRVPPLRKILRGGKAQ